MNDALGWLRAIWSEGPVGGADDSARMRDDVERSGSASSKAARVAADGDASFELAVWKAHEMFQDRSCSALLQPLEWTTATFELSDGLISVAADVLS